MKKLFYLLLLPMLAAGCSTITNLTPSQCPRDPSGLYHVEAEWSSRRQAIRPESFHPLVMVGFNTYPMQPVPVVQDQWEAFVPVPANKDFILYRFKFDFEVNAVSQPRPDSLMSPEYVLKIEPKK